MPSSSFLFDSLSQKLDINNRKKKRDDASIIGAKNTKMFLPESLSKLNSFKSKTVYSGYLKSKTQNTEIKSYYFLLRQYGEKPVKTLLEAYKDDSMKKLKFIIDLDNVEQVDLNEISNTIYLSRSNNELCSLEADNKNLTTVWLNTICQCCGFNEINNNFHQDQLNILNVKQARQKNISQTPHSYQNTHERVTNKHSQIDSPNKNPIDKKVIAGIAAASVGSYDLCNTHLENFFKNKTSNFGENNVNSILSTSQSGKNLAKENYIVLQECLSGLDFEPVTKSNTIESNKSDFSNSFSSSEKLNHRKQSFDEDNSVFDFDASNIINSNFSKDKNCLNIKNKLHGRFYYQDKYKDSRVYYNYAEPQVERKPEPPVLGYVQLVVANGANNLSTFKHNNSNKNNQPIAENDYGFNDSFKSNQIKSFMIINENNNDYNKDNTINKIGKQLTAQYTSINTIRTNALKHTQVEFQRPSS